MWTGRRALLLGLCGLVAGCHHAPASPGTHDVLHVYVVRHAEKQLDAGGDPELTTAGAARAAALPDAVPVDELVAIYSTNTRRTRATVAPVSERTGLEIRSYDVRDPAGLLTAIRSHGRGAVLVAGHSNTIGDMLTTFGVAETITIADDQYGDVFVVTLSDGSASLVRRRFGSG